MGKKKIITKTSDSENIKSGVTIKKSSKKARKVDLARIYINATYNNTFITVTDKQGNVLTWASAGSVGFSGPKKATPFAASKVVSIVSEKMKPFEIKDIEIYVKGIGSGRDSAIRSFANEGYNILLLKDVTPIPHNGPRPPKPRRV
ncbi:MAG: 30S ribosomal protein S11 [Patescibacteria group bacterium]|nr:30S ribosomal protein S11 [Patescibacteria group bacterium]MCX7589505.1 30S ribosomal protein S11 [Patescibacteria group bacterium]MDW8279928.1 30S ribosomal protein S11 [bacterium]